MLRLDIGCGSNKKEGFLGLDINKTEATDIIADATNLPFKDNCIDYIYSRRCIQHVRNDVKALEEIYRVLKIGGKLQLTVASIYGFLYYKLGFSESSGKYEVFHLYFARKLRKMLEKAGFVDIHVSKIKSARKFGYDIIVTCGK